MNKPHNKYFYYILILCTAVMWGSAYPAVRFLSLSGMDGNLIAALRVVMTCCCAVPMLIISRERLDIPACRANFWPFFLMGLIGVIGFFFFMSIGLQYTSAGKGSLIAGSNPIFIVIFSYFFLKEPLPRHKLIGIIMAVIGVAFTVIGADLVAGEKLVFYPADLLMLAACLCWAVYTIIARRHLHDLPYYQGFLLMYLCAGLLVTPLLIHYRADIALLTAEQWLWLFYLGAIPGGAGFFLWNKGVNVLGASVCGMFNSFMPVFAVILSTVFLHETLAWLQLCGGALVIAGVLLGMRQARLPVNYETGESL